MTIKPPHLKKGDTLALVTLSNGALFDNDIALKIGQQRLADFGLSLKVMPHAADSPEYLWEHPEVRAADLKAAFMDDDVKGIVCTIGGCETYRLTPYLLDDPEFVQVVRQHPKVFMGFSDTTLNHLVFQKIGLNTFYGPSFLNDFADLGPEMLPFARDNFAHFFVPEAYQLVSSPVWFDERQDFSANSLGVQRMAHQERYGYETLYGTGAQTGKLLGGCIESLFDLLTGHNFPDELTINAKYGLWPKNWQGKMMFLEPSQENPDPKKLAIYLHRIAQTGVFNQVSGLLVGKSQNQKYFHEYRKLYQQLGERYHLPVLYNVNFGHGFPRLSMPYGVEVEVDFDEQTIKLLESPWT